MEGSAHSFFLAFIAMFLLLGAPLANQEVREEENDFRVTTEYLFVVGGFSPDCACYQKTEIIAVTEGVFNFLELEDGAAAAGRRAEIAASALSWLLQPNLLWNNSDFSARDETR